MAALRAAILLLGFYSYLQRFALKPAIKRVAGRSPAMGFILLVVAGLKGNCCKSFKSIGNQLSNQQRD